MKRVREGEEGGDTKRYLGTACYATYLQLCVSPAAVLIADAHIAVSTQGTWRVVSVLFGF